MELNIAGRTALITGGSKGIGRAVAHGLAAEGCHLHIAARTVEDLAVAKAEISKRYNVSVEVHPADLSDSGARQAVIDATGDIDILINNAGAIPGGDIVDIDDETWRAAWDLKVFGYINMARHYYTAMRERGSGVIVNIAGIAGRLSMPGYIAGCSGNAALIAFTNALGQESIGHGVRVVCVNPGPTLTERLIYLAKIRAEKELGDAERWQDLPSDYRLGRAAESAEIADMVTFLASDRASYMSGVSVDMG